MIIFKIHHSSPSAVRKPIMWNYQDGDYNSIRCHLSTVDWDSCMTGSANECWLTLKNLLLTLEEKFVPVKTRYCKRKPMWMTNKAFNTVRRKLTAEGCQACLAPFPLKILPLCCVIWAPSNTWFFGPPESKSEMACRSVQPVLPSFQQRVTILYNELPFPLKIGPFHGGSEPASNT